VLSLAPKHSSGLTGVLGTEVDDGQEHSWSLCREALAFLGR
jgi:hypothetical protein